MGDVTYLLHRWREGDRGAEQELFAVVMPNLLRLAQHFMQGERKGHSLAANDLVNEIYIKLVAAKDRDWQTRGHFFAYAARAMRCYLIDHWRARPDVEFVRIEGMEEILRAGSIQIQQALTVDKLLNELADSQPEWCRLVELKYFLGLTDMQAAEALGLKLRTMQRMWREVRRWLFEHRQETTVKK
jgi:RNA polymerase sigma factor (TIGR02999 family)